MVTVGESVSHGLVLGGGTMKRFLGPAPAQPSPPRSPRHPLHGGLWQERRTKMQLAIWSTEEKSSYTGGGVGGWRSAGKQQRNTTRTHFLASGFCSCRGQKRGWRAEDVVLGGQRDWPRQGDGRKKKKNAGGWDNHEKRTSLHKTAKRRSGTWQRSSGKVGMSEDHTRPGMGAFSVLFRGTGGTGRPPQGLLGIIYRLQGWRSRFLPRKDASF